MFATVAQDPYGMAEKGIEAAVRAVKNQRVRRNVNTGNPLVTQRNAQAYFDSTGWTRSSAVRGRGRGPR